jgi:hypothetical protein
MRVKLFFVPPGGGEHVYQLDFDLPAPPASGDHIAIERPATPGFQDYIVRRVWWWLRHPKPETPEADAAMPPTSAEPPTPAEPTGNGKYRRRISSPDQDAAGAVQRRMVECEYALGPYSSEAHERMCERFRARGLPLQTFDV